MPKKEWGAKRLCIKCKKKFYDLNMDPMTCPECGASFTLDEMLGNKTRITKDPSPTSKGKENVKEIVVDDIDEDAILLDDNNDDMPDDLDETLLEEDDDETVSFEEITDVSAPEEDS